MSNTGGIVKTAGYDTAGDDIVYDTVGDTIGDTNVTPFDTPTTPTKPIPVVIPKIDKRNYKKSLRLEKRITDEMELGRNKVKRELFPSDTKMKSIS